MIYAHIATFIENISLSNELSNWMYMYIKFQNISSES